MPGLQAPTELFRALVRELLIFHYQFFYFSNLKHIFFDERQIYDFAMSQGYLKVPAIVREAMRNVRFEIFAKDLWIIDGPPVRDFGVMFTTRMIVVKLSDGSLWVDSPVSAPFDVLTRITDLGPIRYLVAATPRHVWRLEEWHTLFPQAQVWIPQTTPLTLKKGPLPFTGVLGDVPNPGWAKDLDQLPFKGNPLIEEVLFFHKESRTVILDDLIQSNPLVNGKPLQNSLIRIGGVAYPHGGVPLDIRLSFINRNAARKSLEKLLSWDFDKLIIAHGDCIKKDAKSFVEQAFHWLKH
jgi:hypothetical protein